MLEGSYYLATPYIVTNDHHVTYGIDLAIGDSSGHSVGFGQNTFFKSDGSWSSNSFYVRPIIALSSYALYEEENTGEGEFSVTTAPTGWNIEPGYYIEETASGNYQNE